MEHYNNNRPHESLGNLSPMQYLLKKENSPYANQDRLFMALTRFVNPALKPEKSIEYLAVKRTGQIRFINITEVIYIKGAGIYTELKLKSGQNELHDKSLEHLQQILSHKFERIHKSYLVNFKQVEKILPIGRSKI